MSIEPNFNDLEFVDGIVPTQKAMDDGIMSYRLVGVNPNTGRYIAAATITKKGQEFLKREIPVEFRKSYGGVQ